MLGYGIKETTATTGTGTLTLSAVTNFPRVADAFLTGDFVFYSILSSAGEPIESGIGTVGSSNTLARTRVQTTYSGGTYNGANPTAVSLSGTSTVIVTALPTTATAVRTGVDSVSAGVYRSFHSNHHAMSYGNTKSLFQNRCYYMPFLLETTIQINGISCIITTGGTAGKIRMGLYRVADSGYMGDIIAQTADITTITTTGQRSGTIGPYLLIPGWYYVALATNSGSGPTIRATASGDNICLVNTPLGCNTSLSPFAVRYEALAGGWSVLPTTPNASTSTDLFSGTFNPMLFLDP